MNREAAKKLHLNRETLRNLTGDEAEVVNGGGGTTLVTSLEGTCHHKKGHGHKGGGHHKKHRSGGCSISKCNGTCPTGSVLCDSADNGTACYTTGGSHGGSTFG